MTEYHLNSSNSFSRIIVGGKLCDAGSFFPGKRIILLADENVIRHHRDSFPSFPVISLGSGESVKSLDHMINIYRELLKYETDRSHAVVGIGGGIATDIAGFVASTFLRGIPFGFVATTLLAQVDASIGGKNGVNLDGYKNMIGVIRQPQFVICDLETLKTLERKEFICGFAEIIKYGAIRDPGLFRYLEENLEDGLNMKEDVLEKMVSESVRNKLEVVERDENEEGERKTLNFGHTFGHAFEKLYKIPHGEAVAAGMVLASKLSVNYGMLRPSDADKLISLINGCGLPVNLPFDSSEITETMKKDKKRAGDEINFILLEEIGKAVIKRIRLQELKNILDDLR